jgi:hypothetical protein
MSAIFKHPNDMAGYLVGVHAGVKRGDGREQIEDMGEGGGAWASLDKSLLKNFDKVGKAF